MKSEEDKEENIKDENKDESNQDDEIPGMDISNKYSKSMPGLPNGSEDAAKIKKEMDKKKEKLEKLKGQIIKKFNFIESVGILPPQSIPIFVQDEEVQKETEKYLHLLVIIPEEKFKEIKKVKKEIVEILEKFEEKIWLHLLTPVDIWELCLDSKFDLVSAIAMSFPIHDKGFLGALRVAEIHKSLVLRKFERYVVSYVIAGSLVRGEAVKTSDVDVFVVINDTDVKRMPRLELKEKLRSIIYQYIGEASALAGVKNVLNVQVYLLTDFWESVKDAHPVIFTFIRDGVPLYDRGTFLPWKALLKMGKIKPSPEAVDNFMKYGEQNESLVKRRLIDAMVDIYYGVITPMQALMMMAGHAPPVPKTMVEEVKKEFFEKEKIISSKELKILEKVVKLFKDYEHGKLQSISGAEIDTLLKEANEYDKKIKQMRTKLEAKIVEHTAESVHKELFNLLKNIFGNHSETQLLSKFEKEMIKSGKMPSRYLPIVKEVSKIKILVKKKKMSQNEIDYIRRNAEDLISKLVEYMQRRELSKVEKGVMQLAYNGKKAELVLTHRDVFLVENGIIKKVGTHSLVDSNAQELQQALADGLDAKDTKLSSHVLEILKKSLG